MRGALATNNSYVAQDSSAVEAGAVAHLTSVLDVEPRRLRAALGDETLVAACSQDKAGVERCMVSVRVQQQCSPVFQENMQAVFNGYRVGRSDDGGRLQDL